MKRNLAIITMVFTLFAFVMPISGQTAKPTFESATGGLQMKVWVMITGEAVKTNDMNTAKPSTKAATGSTYHIMVELKKTNGKVLKDANVSLMTVSPARKNASVELKPMMDQYGSDLILNETGEYEFAILLNAGGADSSTPFKFVVR
jgi:hypothetical protein